MPNSRKKVFRRAIIKKSATGRRITPDSAKFKKFYDLEKNTFTFLRPLILLFFSVDFGIMAALFTQERYRNIVNILATGIFVAMFILLLSIFRFIKSILSVNNQQKFIDLRKSSYTTLSWALMTCLVTFEIALLVFIYPVLEYIIFKYLF